MVSFEYTILIMLKTRCLFLVFLYGYTQVELNGHMVNRLLVRLSSNTGSVGLLDPEDTSLTFDYSQSIVHPIHDLMDHQVQLQHQGGTRARMDYLTMSADEEEMVWEKFDPLKREFVTRAVLDIEPRRAAEAGLVSEVYFHC